jgi:hypothetical protein
VTEPSPEKIRRVLALEIGGNDAGVSTIREYLVRLLTLVWQEGENFNGKRPFGNNGWQGDFDHALITAGLVHGEVDEDGDVDFINSDEVDELVLACIAALDYSAEAAQR